MARSCVGRFERCRFRARCALRCGARRVNHSTIPLPHDQSPEDCVNEKQLAKLIKKNAEKAAKPSKLRPNRAYDPTLTKEETDATDEEREAFFKEMKRREF